MNLSRATKTRVRGPVWRSLERDSRVSAKTENPQTITVTRPDHETGESRLRLKFTQRQIEIPLECVQRRRKIVGITQVVFYLPSFLPLPPSSRLYELCFLERFPRVWYHIFRRDPRRPLPLAQICTRISIFFRTSRAFLLLSKLVLECASRPSFTEKPGGG